LMSLVLVLGILRAAMPRLNPALIQGLHTNIALLTVAFAGLHIVASIVDPFARLTPIDALIPFASNYRRTWLGLGVISAYLYVVMLVISWPRQRLGRGAWLWLHRTLYLAWGMATLHSLGTGSDARNQLFILLDVAAVAGALAIFLGIRVVEAWWKMPRLWSGLAAAALLATLALVAWAVNGPMQPGWARSSGTPPDLIGSP
jgi:methionine sulfoxide reductase heme-binding subunit